MKALFEGTIQPFKLPVLVRYFDVGFSAEFFVKLLEHRGFSVVVLNPHTDIKLNVFEIDNEDDIELTIRLIDVILSTKGVDPLDAYEEGYLQKVLRQLLNIEFRQKVIGNRRLREIKDSYPHLYERAKSKGYDDKTELFKLGEKESDLKMFFYPTVTTVIRLVDAFLKNVDEEEKKIILSLSKKLKALKEIPNFSAWSGEVLENKDFIYIDLHFIKKHSLFVPIYLALMTKILKATKDFSKVKLFVLDEFHNFTKFAEFKRFFDTLIREAAKRNMFFWFITQYVKEIPEEIAVNINTKVLLKPVEAQEEGGEEGSDSSNKGNGKEISAFSQGVSRIGIPMNALKRFEELPRYTPFFFYGNGFTSLNPPLDEVKLKVFESRKIPVLETPDGFKIIKTFVEEE